MTWHLYLEWKAHISLKAETHGYCVLQAADTLSHWPRHCRSRIQDKYHHTASAVLSLRVTDSSSLLALTCDNVHRVVPTREDHPSLGIQSSLAWCHQHSWRHAWLTCVQPLQRSSWCHMAQSTHHKSCGQCGPSGVANKHTVIRQKLPFLRSG